MVNSEENFINELIKTYGENPYVFITKFQGNTKPIKVKCKKCKTIKEYKYARNLIFKRGKIKYDYFPCSCNKEKYSKPRLNNNFIKLEKRIEELSGIKNLYTLLDDEFKGNKVKTHLKCNICGYDKIYATTTNIIGTLLKSNGEKYYCPSCNKLIRSKDNFFIRLEKNNPDIECLEDKNTKILLKNHYLFKCKICNYEWKAIAGNVVRGSGCPNCSHINTISKNEINLLNFIKSIYNNTIVTNNRKILEGQELDIYLPDKNIAFEFDGLYWHNFEKKGINYHLNKTKLCQSKGIRLIHIFEDEWINKQDIVKSKIKHILGLNTNPKIYARKCFIEEIEPEDKNQFLNENHIQGEDRSKIKLGLWYPINDEESMLVSVMTFCKPRKSLNGSSEYDYELSRFASEINYNVIGGFSKLLSYFKKNYKWNKIITYADRRWSVGNVYEKNGFNLHHISKPNYWYFHRNNNIEKYHRYKFRKQELKNKFPNIYNNNLSEYQIMKKANYLKIYDCGNYVYEFIKPL